MNNKTNKNGNTNGEFFNMKTSEKTTQKNTNRPQGKKTWYTIGAILALLCFAAASFWSLIWRDPVEQKESAECTTTITQDPDQDTSEMINSKFRVIFDEHNARNKQLYDDFCQKIAVAGESEFQEAIDNIDRTVEHFGEFKVCRKLIFAIARDKIKKTNNAQEIIRDGISDTIIVPCNAGTTQAWEVLCDFQHKLQGNDNLLREKFIQNLKEISVDSSDLQSVQEFQRNIADIQEQIENRTVQTAFTAGGIAIEFIMLKQTMSVLIRVSSALVGKILASSAAPLLDGPLPIGDIIAIVGLVWCGWDIYQIKEVIPGKMRESIHDSITDHRNTLRKELRERGHKIFDEYNQSSAEVMNLITELN